MMNKKHGEILDIVGERIKECRKLRGWTQEQLAEHSDLSVNYLATIETGRRIPSLQVLVRIAETLGIEASDLLSRGQNEEQQGALLTVCRMVGELSEEDENFLANIIQTLADRLKKNNS